MSQGRRAVATNLQESLNENLPLPEMRPHNTRHVLHDVRMVWNLRMSARDFQAEINTAMASGAQGMGIHIACDMWEEIQRLSASQWQPIATAPRDGTDIMIYSHHHGITQAHFSAGYWSEATPDHDREYSSAAWVCGDDAWQIEIEEVSANEFHDGEATHWMPLPPLPQGVRN